MKKLLTSTLGVVVLLASTDLGGAQQKGVEKSQPTDIEMRQGKGPPQDGSSKCGTVTNINPRTKTLTIRADGKEVNFDASAMKSLPRLGDTVVVNYVPGSGDPLKGLNVSKSKG